MRSTLRKLHPPRPLPSTFASRYFQRSTRSLIESWSDCAARLRLEGPERIANVGADVNEIALAQAAVKDGQICIAGFSFPGAVQKLVLGQQSKKGPAFLQLAWNGSELWLFPLDELPQVQQFIRQHAPHIEIIRE